MDDFRADLRSAVRGIAHHPLLSAIAIITLAGGIGISSGVFTLFDAAVLRPRIQADPGSFAQVFTATDPEHPGRLGDASLDDYAIFMRARTLRSLAAHHRYLLPGPESGEQKIPVLLATCNFFDTIEAGPPLAGRVLQPQDCDTAAPVAVIDEALWRTRFGSDLSAIGSPMEISGAVVTIVGVARASAGAVESANAWMPLTLRRHLNLGTPSGTDRWLSVEGRLVGGSTRRQAAAELAVLAANGDAARKSTVIVTDGSLVSDPRKPFVVPLITLNMSALSALVLIACANIAVLLLSHADARQQEMAVRLSLGAGRARLLRMLLTETLVLAACAGAGAVWLAYEVPILMFKWFGGGLPPYSLAPDWRAFAFLAATTGLAGVVSGLAPALESMRVDVLDALRGRRALLGAAGGSALRHSLVAVQIALSFVLLVGAGLFSMTHYRIVTGDPGFDAPHLLIVRGDATPVTLAGIVSGLPGVRATAFASTGPASTPAAIRVSLDGVSPQRADVNEISPDYLLAVGIPVVRGRGLDASDGPCGSAVTCHVVVSEEFVRRIAGGADPLGRVLRSASGDMEIVGIVRDLSAQQIGVADPPMVYQPWRPGTAQYQVVAKFDGDPAAFSRAAVATLRERLPGANTDARTARWYIDAWVDEVGPLEVLILALGAAAAGLAVIGVFGVMSFTVSRRARELGLRVALGARPPDIYAAVLGNGLKPAAAGLTAGVVLALGTSAAFGSLLSQMHFAISVRDPLTYGLVGAVLGTVVFTALLVPARRAAHVDPYAALRRE